MSLIKSTIAAASADGGGPAPPPGGDITATDPLGLSVGQNINWTVSNVPPVGAKRWGPGHFLFPNGNASDQDQNNYWITKVENQINLKLGLSTNLKGVYMGVAWKSINPTGSTFDWTLLDQTFDLIKSINNGRLGVQLMYKSFTSQSAEYEAPADLFSDIEQNNTGWIAAVYRPHVMDRYILALQAIKDRYDDDPNFEIIATPESVPSWAGSAPADYTDTKMFNELIRMYAEGAAMFTNTNFAPGINSLGDFTAELLEECYQLRIGVQAPDARGSTGTEAFAGNLADSVRDYRGELMRSNQVSFSALAQQTPQESYDFAVNDGCTHLNWASAGGADYDFATDIIPIIDANEFIAYSTCPNRYNACSLIVP